MECRVCKFKTIKFAEAKILNKYEIQYYLCENCGFIQTEQPYWLLEAYDDSINIYDTGILQRNMHFAKRTAVLLHTLFADDCKYLDYAGGYGIFCRLMRDMGFNYFWSDPYTKNLVARGFEFKETQKIDLLTSFESFEHFEFPMEEIGKMISISNNILFSIQLYPLPPPSPREWWYYGLDHGQHIAFYSEKTLRYIAKHFNLNFHTDGKNLHLLTQQNLQLENLSTFLRYRFLLIGKWKINNLIKRSGELYTHLYKKFDNSQTFKDMLFLQEHTQKKNQLI